MLREDHLVDADRAMGEMRRDVRSGSVAAAAAAAEAGEQDAEASLEPEARDGAGSAGLTLVELYRDVKTGHPAEAIELFRARLPLLREKLGHRVGDAWALLARAHDMLGHENDAQTAWENATALTDRLELERRYPEVATLSAKYRATEVPAAA